MGLFDDAVPGGNITKPLLIALGALLAGKMFSGSGNQDREDDAERLPPAKDAAPEAAPPRTADKADDDGGIFGGGIGDLLDRLAKQGNKDEVDSWVGKGENRPVPQDDLGKAIGGPLLDELSRRTGISKDQLLEQLSKALPGVVDKLTPEGRVPTRDQVAGQFRDSPW